MKKYLLLYKNEPESIVIVEGKKYVSIIQFVPDQPQGSWIFKNQVDGPWAITSITEEEIALLVVGGYKNDNTI